MSLFSYTRILWYLSSQSQFLSLQKTPSLRSPGVADVALEQETLFLPFWRTSFSRNKNSSQFMPHHWNCKRQTLSLFFFPVKKCFFAVIAHNMRILFLFLIAKKNRFQNRLCRCASLTIISLAFDEEMCRYHRYYTTNQLYVDIYVY